MGAGLASAVVVVVVEVVGGVVFISASRSCPTTKLHTLRTVRLRQSATQMTLAHGADQHITDVPRASMTLAGGRIL